MDTDVQKQNKNQNNNHSHNYEWRLFDFTDVEEKILIALLERGPTIVSKISCITDIPRTTIYSALLRLKDRGFVKKITKGQKKWKINKLSKIKNLTKQGLNDFEEYKQYGEEIVGGIDANEIGVTVYRGKQQIEKAYEKMLNLSKAERVFAIQGNRSAKLVFKRLEKQYILDFHKKFKKAHIIMEGINGEETMNLFKNLTINELKSHLNRMLIATILPDQFMDFGLDIVVFRDIIIIINLDKELVIFIKNRDIVEMFHKFVLFFQEYGRKINFNKYIWNIIEEKQRA